MNRTDDGRRILREAEKSLQQLLAEAAKDGDYAALPLLADWAQQVAGLLEPDQVGRSESQSPLPTGRHKTKTARKPSKGKRSASYPKFIKDEDNLVKIGWSKSDGSEYEHKARKDVVRAVVASISRAGRRGTRFTMESVLPLSNFDGSQIPDYQSYLILAWLRSTQLVLQHGRLGPSLKTLISLKRSKTAGADWPVGPMANRKLPDGQQAWLTLSGNSPS